MIRGPKKFTFVCHLLFARYDGTFQDRIERGLQAFRCAVHDAAANVLQTCNQYHEVGISEEVYEKELAETS